jgi:hypothetical protein
MVGDLFENVVVVGTLTPSPSPASGRGEKEKLAERGRERRIKKKLKLEKTNYHITLVGENIMVGDLFENVVVVGTLTPCPSPASGRGEK